MRQQDLQLVKAAAQRPQSALRGRVVDEEAAGARHVVAVVLALELGVREARFQGLRDAEGLSVRIHVSQTALARREDGGEEKKKGKENLRRSRRRDLPTTPARAGNPAGTRWSERPGRS